MSESDTPLEAIDAPVMPAVVVPDRADAPVSEVTERFLRAVIASVPLERIEELHLFAPLRQGGVETGIAVIAARVPAVEMPEATATDAPEADAAEADAAESDAAESDTHDDEETVSVESDTDGSVHAEQAVADVTSADVTSADVTSADDVAESPYLEDALAVPTVLDATPEHTDEEPASMVRHTVYTARYRLVLKGPERGKWEADVVDEADAPLVTVEMVVRGVQRRAGEETEILRYSDRQIARALRMSWPQPVIDAQEPVAG